MRKIILLPALLLIGTLLFALGRSESVSYTQTGVIVIAGNEPHTEVILKGGDGKAYLLTGKRAKELIPYQNREVAVTGLFKETSGFHYEYELEVESFSSDQKPMTLPPSR